MVSTAPDGWVDSPFRAKGVLYRGTVSFFEEHAERGIGLVIDELPPGRLKHFLAQQFQAGSWYEVMIVPALIDAEARALRMSLETYLVYRTRWQAERDTKGVYRLLLKLSSPATVVERLPQLITQMFNFGRPFLEQLEPRRVGLSVSGIPLQLVPWLETSFRVYIETAVKLAGASECEMKVFAPNVQSPRSGFSMATLRGEVSWS